MAQSTLRKNQSEGWGIRHGGHRQLACGIGWLRITAIAICAVVASAFLPLSLRGDEKVEILRDEYGVAHIFAATPAAAAFGSGYAQAEDRLEEML
ncbi:MAG: hypothetical protein DMG61_16440, partial [Acidobacteria bacterium]